MSSAAARTSSIWLARAPARPLAAPLVGSVAVDVVVVGAGVCGAAAVWSLARAGVSVAWLEAGEVAGEATGRNAGFVLQGTAERYDRAVAILGRERARAVHALSVHNHQRMSAVVAELGIDCDYRVRGSLQLAGTPHEEDELRTSARWLVEDGFSAEVWSADQLPPALAGRSYRMGVFLPGDGELDPVRFVRGVASAAVGQGVRLFERSPVVALDAGSPGDVTVRTPEGEVKAEVAVVCTNARAGELLGWCADTVDPVRGQMLATAPAPRGTFPIPVYADHGYDYWRQLECGRIVLGGWRNLDPTAEVGHDDRLHTDIQAKMAAFLHSFPGLSGLAIEHRWSGTMGFSRDGLPLVGAAPGAPGAVVGVGFTGHGFGFAWASGEALARLVIDGRHPTVDLLTPSRLR